METCRQSTAMPKPTQGKRSTHPRSKRTQKGFTLIEVLISFVIFAFGMLGAAGLQIWSLKASKQSTNVGVAASLIRDYSDLMISTPVGGTGTSGFATQGATSPFYIGYNSAEIKALAGGVDASQCLASGCTAEDFANSAIRDWLQRLDVALPKARVVVCVDSTPLSGDNYRWECDGQGSLVVAKLRWHIANTKANSGEDQTENSDKPPLTVVTVFGTTDDYFKKN